MELESEQQEELESSDTDVSKGTRRDFIVLAATAVACTGAAVTTLPFIRSLAPDAGVLAVGSIEVDVSNIKPGETITTMWRGKPTFVTRRTEKQIEEARNVDIKTLPDPQADEARVKQGKEEWLVTIAICTHLGCVPISNKGDYDGWFCPCHGSQYDSSGRVRKGPAPQNLAIPPYEFMSDTKIKIG